MHIIHLHIGDFQDATKRYEPEAVGIYILLLFEYYKTEKPLPADMEELEFLCGVRTKSERQSLRFVLKRCFVLSEDTKTYTHKRCDREIENYRANCIQNRFAILCRHWEKVNSGVPRPSYEDFAADVSRYYDDSTKRIRQLTARKPSEATPNSSGITSTIRSSYPPVTSNQEPVTRNQETTPVVPKGTDGASDKPQLFDQTIRARSDQPAKPQKKKGGAASEGVVEMPSEWSDIRRAKFGEWFAHRLSLGKFITPDQFASAIASTSGLTDAQVAACIEDAIEKKSPMLEPYKFGSSARDFFDAATWIEDIYNAYPRKIGKPTAKRAIEKALRKTQIAPAELLKRTQTFAVAVAKWTREARYTREGADTVPHPSTWFNQHRFNDDPAEWEKKPREQKKEGGGTEVMIEPLAHEIEPNGWQSAFEREFGSAPTSPWKMLHPTTQETITKRLDREAMEG